ncbi:hypothetical protein [Actinocorallia libanotica]|uniref:Pyrroloquinoline-quinone binding quinoprotein n=1 Tax=Actinocorallia libanotica TaxID=46162 RepID=A0ABP4B7M7_9ACTN
MTGQPVENLEETLNRTLERHAEKAPAPASDLIDRVETRYRKRRRVRTTGAAAAMALVLSGTAFGMWSDGGGPTTLLESSGTSTQALSRPGQKAEDPFETTPIEKLWPEAVHQVPARLQDGTEITPQALIDARTVLVSAWASFEKASALYAYDLATGKAEKITDVVTPKGTWLFASGFTVGDGKILWQTTSADRMTTIWSVPVEGGTPVAAVENIPAEAVGPAGSVKDGATAVPVEPSPSGVAGLGVFGGRVYWSGSPNGVYTAPLTGGSAELVAGTEKERLVRWPWAGRSVSDRTQGGDKTKTIRWELRNLETGEKKPVFSAPGGTDWNCWITWCSSVTENALTTRDGSQMTDLPGHLLDRGVVALDRFVLSVDGSRNKASVMVNDLQEGRTGSIALTPTDGGVSYSVLRGAGSRMYATPTADGHVIVDLEAID